jgi:hypothetical protein
LAVPTVKQQRVLDYLGFRSDTVPSQRSWVARISNPAFATAQRDRWFGALFWVLLIAAAISVLSRGSWPWYVIGAIDLLIAVPSLINCLRYMVQRRPTL